jgi:hypothetical protein
MADEQLKLIIGAETGQATAAVNQFNKAVTAIKPASNSAAFALNNLGRVAQDLPFGFIGISNNLNPLLESFQRLKAESGSSSAALKALAGSLIGGGGVGLALSAVTAIITFATNGFGAWTRGMHASAEQAKKTADAMDTIIQNTGEEVSKIEVLINFIEKETTSRQQRIAAIKQLQTISPAYFAQLDAEKATVNDVSAAYAAFSQNITNSITARIREGQLKGIIEERIKLQDFVNSLGKEENVIINGTLVKARNFLLNTKDKTNAQARINQLLGQEKTITEEINNLKPPDLHLPPPKVEPKDKKALTLDELFTVANNKGDELFLRIREQAADQLNKAMEDVAKKNAGFFAKLFMQTPARQGPLIAEKVLPTTEDMEVVFADRKQQLLNAFAKFKITPPDISAVSEKGAQVSILEQWLRDRGLSAEGIANTIADLNKMLDQQFKNIKITLFETLGETLGSALAAGNFNNVLGGFLSVLGDAAIELGKIAIATGLAMTGIKAAFKSLNPATAIGAGVALIALGTLVKAKVASVPKFAEGGIVTRPTLGLFGEAGPEAVIPLSKMNGMGGTVNVEGRFTIQGRDLVAVVAKTNRSLNRIT